MSIDYADPKQVACAWSALVEPGDESAGILVDALGAAEALEWVLSKPAADSLPSTLICDESGQERPWVRALARWLPRLQKLNVERDLEAIDRVGGSVIYRGHPNWPVEFNDLGNAAPHALWIRGQLKRQMRVALVGARACTHYGRELARDFAWELARAGKTVVSGGALGIDTAAHAGAVRGGHTVAVMAGGVCNLYPRSNEELFSSIMETGAIISEGSPFSRPARWRFLARNRLIAAYCSATIVVEAGYRSGALATLNRALELGRAVGAVPGSVFSSQSAGCHEAIRNGASLVVSAQQICELVDPIGTQLELTLPAKSAGESKQCAPTNLSDAQQRVWDALPRRGWASADNVACEAGLSMQEVLPALAALVLAGQCRGGNGVYARS